MKFTGFNFSAGLLDVRLDKRSAGHETKLQAFKCGQCEYIAPLMLWCRCGHVMCRSCSLLPQKIVFEKHDKASLLDTQCPICQLTTKGMLIEMTEEFVAEIHCVCPRCFTSVKLADAGVHLRGCSRKPSRRPSDKSTSSKIC